MFRRSALFLVVAFLVPLIVCAADAGTVEGKLVIGNKTIKLTHVYAIVQGGDGSETFYKIFLSDVVLTDKDLTFFPDPQMQLIKGDKLHVLKLGLDNERHFYAVDIFAPGTLPTIKEPARFELIKFDDKVIAGRLHLDKPYRDMDGTTYQFDVKFNVPLRPQSEFMP